MRIAKNEVGLKTINEIQKEIRRVEEELFLNQDDDYEFRYLEGYQDGLNFTIKN